MPSHPTLKDPLQPATREAASELRRAIDQEYPGVVRKVRREVHG